MTKVRVKAVKRYSDVILKRIVKKDEILEVNEDRAKHLVKEGMAVILNDTGKEAEKKGAAK